MSANPYKIIIELPTSDGFHTQGNLHLAEIAKDKLVAFLKGPGGVDDCRVRVVTDPEDKL